MKKIFFLFCIFFLIDAFIYWNLWDTYFQQDEWRAFARAIYQGQNLPFGFFQFGSTHFHPLAEIVWFIQYKLFGFNATYFSIIALFFHSIASVLAFIFFNRLVRSRYIAFALAFLLLVSFPTKQVVVWFAVPYTLVLSVIFILLFFIYLDTLKNQAKFSKKNLLTLGTLFLFSLFFREEGMTLIILSPVFIFLFWDKNKKLKALKSFIVLFIFMIGIVVLRFILEIPYGEHVQFEKDNNLIMTLYNFLTVPPKMIIQNLLELEHLWNLSRFYTSIAFPRLLSDGIAIETIIFEHIVFMLFIPLAVLTGYAFSKMDQVERKIFIFSIIWILISSAIISPQTRRLLFLESRYLFFGSIGTLLLLYTIFFTFWQEKKLKKIVYTTSIVLVLIFAIYSYFGIQRIMNTWYIPFSKERKPIVEQILKMYPEISENTVFYVKCRNKEDCIDTVFPFQSGFGQMLLVLYGSKNERAYSPFLEGVFLWDPISEGYRKYDDTGFGYFRDLKKVGRLIVERKLLPDEVIALSYDRSENKVEDISKETRDNLTKMLELAPQNE